MMQQVHLFKRRQHKNTIKSSINKAKTNNLNTPNIKNNKGPRTEREKKNRKTNQHALPKSNN